MQSQNNFQDKEFQLLLQTHTDFSKYPVILCVTGDLLTYILIKQIIDRIGKNLAIRTQLIKGTQQVQLYQVQLNRLSISSENRGIFVANKGEDKIQKFRKINTLYALKNNQNRVHVLERQVINSSIILSTYERNT